MNSILLSFLIFISVFYGVHSFAMEKPPGSPVDFGHVGDNVQQINLRETKETYLEIVLITGAAQMPEFHLLDGDNEAFFFAFTHSPTGNAGEFIGTFLSSVDYEKLNVKYFRVQVTDGKQTQDFKLNIIDIPRDEHPEFESIPLICRMNENTEIDKYNTTCLYKISNLEKKLDFLRFQVEQGANLNFGMEFVYTPTNEAITAKVGLFMFGKSPAFNHSIDAMNSYNFYIQVYEKNSTLPPVTCPYTRIPVIVMIVPSPEHTVC